MDIISTQRSASCFVFLPAGFTSERLLIFQQTCPAESDATFNQQWETTLTWIQVRYSWIWLNTHWLTVLLGLRRWNELDGASRLTAISVPVYLFNYRSIARPVSPRTPELSSHPAYSACGSKSDEAFWLLLGLRHLAASSSSLERIAQQVRSFIFNLSPVRITDSHSSFHASLFLVGGAETITSYREASWPDFSSLNPELICY